MDFDPESEGDYHLFRIDITEVGYTRFEGKLNARTWRPDRGSASA